MGSQLDFFAVLGGTNLLKNNNVKNQDSPN